MDNYVDAYIRVKVPKWQIGQEVSVYFKDTMYAKGICKEMEVCKHSKGDLKNERCTQNC